MLSLFNRYKWYVLAVGFLVYSVGVWNVSAGIQNAGFTKKELDRTEKILETTISNQQLADAVSKAVQEALAEYNKTAKEQTKELLNEINKDPRYQSCRTSDSVRDNLQRKLDSQPK